MEVEKRHGISVGTMVLLKIPETCEYLKPRKKVSGEGDTMKGQRELIAGAAGEEAELGKFTLNSMK